jgi:alcohol dehydrogenase class IV
MFLPKRILMNFNLLLPRKIVCGWGRRSELGTLAAQMGKRAFLVDGSRSLRASPLWDEMLESLRAAGIETIPVATATREPAIEDVDQATRMIREASPGDEDFVLGIGGGAALDLAKALSAMATNRHGESVRDFLEGVGRGLTLRDDPLPMLAVPTTAGTGTEATKNAVISVADPPCKKSLRSEKMVPHTVLIDAELTVSLPPRQTACSGMDAITQLIESFITHRTTPVTEALCREGLKLALPHLPRACRDGTDRPAREAMAVAALLSGVTLANSGLGMAHGVAAALGAIRDVPHGLACAVMLPVAMQVNRSVAEEKLAVIGTILEGDGLMLDDAVAAALNGIERLCEEVGIPKRLREIGVIRDQIPAIVAGSRGNSMNGNPRELSDDELTAILEERW